MLGRMKTLVGCIVTFLAIFHFCMVDALITCYTCNGTLENLSTCRTGEIPATSNCSTTELESRCIISIHNQTINRFCGNNNTCSLEGSILGFQSCIQCNTTFCNDQNISISGVPAFSLSKILGLAALSAIILTNV